MLATEHASDSLLIKAIKSMILGCVRKETKKHKLGTDRCDVALHFRLLLSLAVSNFHKYVKKGLALPHILIHIFATHLSSLYRLTGFIQIKLSQRKRGFSLDSLGICTFSQSRQTVKQCLSPSSLTSHYFRASLFLKQIFLISTQLPGA